MVKLDMIFYSLKHLVTKRTRSFLTVLSVLIGIMAIFAIISFGLGLSYYVEDISNQMGANKIMIMPAGGQTAAFTDSISKEDLEFVRKINGVDIVTGLAMSPVQIQTKEDGTPKFVFAMGGSTDTEERTIWEDMLTVDLDTGKRLKTGDKLKAVLGYNYKLPEKIFEKPIQLGQKIWINGEKVEVIGFYESIGNAQDDSNIYMTLDGFEELMGISDEYGYLIAVISQGEDITAMSDKIEDKLRKFKDEEEGKESFTVQSFEEVLESFGQVIDVMNMVLVMIALISVVISGINIMNTMYTSVLERTKEIGIMKSIGAQNNDILSVFVIESGFLGMVGGALGILLGWAIAKTGGIIAAQSGYGFLQPIFPLYLIMGCLLFAFGIGAISGLAPAIQASKQKPVDSLRYE